jgi:3D (Asp-Asp-Asp) domain-containing protein
VEGVFFAVIIVDRNSTYPLQRLAKLYNGALFLLAVATTSASFLRKFFVIILLCTLPIGGLSAKEQILQITATAYNSVPEQTQGNSKETAWGEQLIPGMKAIAVSRDLIDRGLTHGVAVKIQGLPGTYRVMDKLHKRWRERIDIYMGEDVQAAKQWGKQEVTIRW